MFSKRSRYFTLPDEVTVDRHNRFLPAKSLRLKTEVTGTFQHTIEAVDRLDHLAYKYYKQSRNWWRICDANPEFLSPLALLGQEVIVTDRFPLNLGETAAQPPWANLRQSLLSLVGVVDLQVIEEIELVRTICTVEGQAVIVDAEHPKRALLVTYNQMNISASAITEVIWDILDDTFPEPDPLPKPERIGRVGKQIIIPPVSTR